MARSSGRAYRRTPAEWLKSVLPGLALVVGLYYILIAPALESTRNPKGPYGEWIPSEPPLESNRITVGNGLSIVAPVNWDRAHEFNTGTPYLCIACRGRPGARLESVITVTTAETFLDEQSLDGLTDLMFQGCPAHERMQVVRHDSFDDPAISEYELYVDRDGVWWHITFMIADEMTELPPQIRQYIDTIQFP